MAGFSIGQILQNRRAGEASTSWFNPSLQAPETLNLTSENFADGETMPSRLCGRGIGDNTSPHLAWSGMPEGTAELVLIVEDWDVPLRRPLVHLALANISPFIDHFDEGDLNAGVVLYGTGTGSFGLRGYTGPRPVRAHGPHHYAFQLFAVNHHLSSGSGAAPNQIIAAMSGKVSARGRLVGVYER